MKSNIPQQIYEYLRLTVSDFDRIPKELICEEILTARAEIELIPNVSWREQVIYKRKQLPFFMLVFEVKKNILNRFKG